MWEADVDDVRQDVNDRLREGRGAIGVADQSLPAAVEAAEKTEQRFITGAGIGLARHSRIR